MLQVCLQQLSLCPGYPSKGACVVLTIGGVQFTIVALSQVSSVKFPRLKEVDDVLGGAAAWENVDTTDGGRN